MRPWLERGIEPEKVDRLAESSGISRIQARILLSRGIEDASAAAAFLDPSYDDLHDPFLFQEMTRAVELVLSVIDRGGRILVHGDYDADGICGAALLYRWLEWAGADVHYFVPDRARDGYGLSMRMLKRGVEAGLDLLISVDCGSSDGKEMSFLAGNGVETVITDHHEIGTRPEDAGAFLNPKLPGEVYPCKDLAGVGVAYKLLQGLASRRGGDGVLRGMLDLVAVGTLGDYSPLTGENRVLVTLGLRSLERWENPGLAALRASSRLPAEGLTARKICFTIVPRLNSPGRMGRARKVVELLTTDDVDRAGRIAAEIEEVNTRRKQLDSEVTDKASYLADMVLKKGEPGALVFSSDEWHEGVVGIGAARLAEKYDLPSVLIAVMGGKGKGSARSARSVNIKEALERCSELLTAFGGHKEAGGFTVPEANIAEFSRCFEAAVREGLPVDEREEAELYDVEVALEDCTEKLVGELWRMAPFGPGNPEPLLLVKGIEVLSGTRIVGNGHLKIDASTGVGEDLSIIGFSLGRAWNPVDMIGRRMDVLANLGINEFRGKREVQLVIRGARYSEEKAGAVL